MEMMPKHPSTGGKCMGYWTVQLGGLNQFMQIWQYDSLAHRYECRKILDANQEWKRHFEEPLHRYLASESNMLMTRVYREGTASTLSYKYLMQLSSNEELDLSGASANLAGTFHVVIGEDEGKYVHIVKARKLDDLVPLKPQLNNISRIMGPVRWSTLLGTVWR
ncbi:hypothetical protein STCU_01992 [Strigomonas culicis]|uniref:NIPSNAP domain-containing protein n=1 Tax=Strigomonas culicis TaxID=28005 RepID=S9UYF2_9TRYP|nr:hypothetical protein STCU_01992 [Strigomonas culicis]|eukprot:EPY33774.1 hypothetical protein STCU_01992 [Strigomonas culicis]